MSDEQHCSYVHYDNTSTNGKPRRYKTVTLWWNLGWKGETINWIRKLLCLVSGYQRLLLEARKLFPIYIPRGSLGVNTRIALHTEQQQKVKCSKNTIMINVLRVWIKYYCAVKTATTNITITPRKDQGQELVILYILVWQPFSPIIILFNPIGRQSV